MYFLGENIKMGNSKPSNSALNSPLEDEKTEGVSTALGDPKKAILKFSWPTITSMILTSIYSLINAVWVSGLGADSLAAVGFVIPLFTIIVGLNSGLGVGATSAISRYIGANDKKNANNAAMHTVIITIGISLILTIILLIFLKPILILFGAGSVLNLAVQYGQVIIIGTVFFLFEGSTYGILRAEGDFKRTLYAISVSSVVNMILDPILIYILGLGISGAAWGSVISTSLVTIVLIYWLFIKRDTYVSFFFKDFKPNKTVTKNILSVGLPASVEYSVLSVYVIYLNALLVTVAGTNAVAVYNTGWRVVSFATSPIIAIGISLVTVVGAAYGAEKYENISLIHNYSIKFSLLIAAILSAIIFIFAKDITNLFTYASTSAYLAPSIASFLQIICLFLLFLVPGLMSSSLFQGVGKGTTSLMITLFRDLVCIVIATYTLSIVLRWGEYGVWWGILLGSLTGSLIAYIWTRIYIRNLKKD